MKNFMLYMQYIFFLNCYGILAQNFDETTSLNPSLENFIPNSPEVSAFQKFGNYPVNEATGVPALSIPIYSYANERNDLKLDISLDYHLGGVKIHEKESREGLGWVLSAGGMISRNLRGIADEIGVFGFLNNSLPIDENEGNSPSSSAYRPFNRIYANVEDGQPDVFNYSFNGHSGKFLLGKNGDILLLNKSNIKIEKFIGDFRSSPESVKGIVGFIITDENGIKYYFENFETTVVFNLNPNSKYSSAWFLTKIKSYNSDQSIVIEYEPEDQPSFSTPSSSRYKRIDGYGDEISSGTINTIKTISCRVKKINFPDSTKIEFNYSALTPNFGHLEKITIHDKSFRNYGFLLKHDQSLNRLTLKEIIPFFNDSSRTLNPYSFEYIGSMPSYTNSIPDHWGYHTGRRGSLIPHEIFPGGLGNGIFELPGSNRDTDSSFVKFGSLKKISYPTGGYTIFDMEANQAYDSWLDQEFTRTQSGGVVNQSTSFTIDSNANYGENVFDIYYEGENQSQTDFQIKIPGGNYCSQCSVHVRLFSSTNYGLTPIKDIEIPNNLYGMTSNFFVENLQNGHTYKMLFYTENMPNSYLHATINWQENHSNSVTSKTYKHEQPFVGGLRVKRILNYDGISGIPTDIKKFTYLMPDGTSSGTLGVTPHYSHATRYENRWGELYPFPSPESYFPSSDNVIVRSSNAVRELAYSGGSPVLYKRVQIESMDGNTSLGKEVKYFTNYQNNTVNSDYKFPYTPSLVDDWKLGLLVEDSIFDSSDNLIKSVHNTYKYTTDEYYNDLERLENFRGISIAPVVFYTGNDEIPALETPQMGLPVHFLMDEFFPSAGRVDIEKSIIKTYSASGINSEITSYQYNPENFNVKSVSKNKSNQKDLRIEYKYSYDYLGNNDPYGIHQFLLNKNDISSVISQQSFMDNSPIMEKRYSYKFFNGFPRINFVQSGKKNSLENRIEYYKYCANGNPLEISMSDGPHIVYLWGYEGEYPIAKIENTTGQEVANALGLAVSSLEDVDEDDFDDINNLRSNLPGAQVTTYTYDPLVGVTSITDPRGKTITYAYDAFGRLEFVKDDALQLLEEYKYHYKNLTE